MTAPLHVLREKMEDYFDERTRDLDAKANKYDKKYASLPELFMLLEIMPSEFQEFESGTPDERFFYERTILRYRVYAERAVMLRVIDTKQMQQLENTVFKKSSTGGKFQNVVLSFPDWNAPDDYEVFKKLEVYCESRGLKIKDLRGKLESMEIEPEDKPT